MAVGDRTTSNKSVYAVHMENLYHDFIVRLKKYIYTGRELEREYKQNVVWLGQDAVDSGPERNSKERHDL